MKTKMTTVDVLKRQLRTNMEFINLPCAIRRGFDQQFCGSLTPAADEWLDEWLIGLGEVVGNYIEASLPGEDG